MKEHIQNHDDDIRAALHHKLDNIHIPEISDEMMNRVIQRLPANSPSTTRRNTWMKFATMGIAASIIVAISTWMFTAAKPIPDYKSMSLECTTTVTELAEVHSEIQETASSIRKDGILASAHPNCDTSAADNTPQNAIATNSNRKKTQNRKKTLKQNSATHTTTASTQELLSVQTNIDNGNASLNISDFTQETQDVLCARLDMAAQQTAEIRQNLDW